MGKPDMVEHENGSRFSFQNGLEWVRELLRQARRSEDETEIDHLLTQCVELLCKLSPLAGEEKETALPHLLSRMGLGLAREGRLSLWATLLNRFSQEASSRRDLAAIKVSTQTVDLAASQPSLEAIFQRFQQPAPPRVDALVELLHVLPATALALATRLAIQCVPEFLLEPVREYCRAASEHHVAGLVELAADPDPAVARFALSSIATCTDERARRVAAESLRHADPAVRIAAIQCLGQQGNEGGTKLLLDRLDRRFKTPLAENEEIALYGALITSGRHDALARVEERLVGPPPTLTTRLKSLVSSTTGSDTVTSAVIQQLVANPTPQAHDLLQRGTHATSASVARARREALLIKT
jgi:HEAT repeat protein